MPCRGNRLQQDPDVFKGDDVRQLLLLAGILATGIMLLPGCTMDQLAALQGPANYAVSPSFQAQQTWRTAVLPPSTGSSALLGYSSGLYDYAGMALLRTGRFTVVDRSIVDSLLDEQEFSYSGVVDQATAVRVGSLLGAEAVMTISITSVTHDDFFSDSPEQRDAALHVKIISVETSEVLYSAIGQGSDFEGAEGALRMAMEIALYGLSQ
jgi:curli biogenesis system outer membrane secretion channel CsgG